ncbi:mitochondrial inner membrane protein-domain-containing protein [Cokeromyces recurvatus]|uniref:mitochondrial inner membrane protein-domain-containing protein n=1 Tax=Cokeromyces recurvatus TaxID=90255 RepID=UPI00221E9CF2|nr:mitochondrial inner membrane protein-domain-containing protein [Cokeromyces recurvatus]KAI7905869.1 mitochondrial inner membrane protein-domain-containing protein [Cokeromyces recurvatus]
MLRGAIAARSTTRLITSRSSHIHITKRLYATADETATTAVVKSGSSIGKKLLWLTLFTGTAYSGAAYLALKNEAFYDTFTTYIPGGENLLDALEDFIANDRFQHYYTKAVQFKAQTSQQTESFKKFADNTKEAVQDWYEYVSDVITELRDGTAPTPINSNSRRSLLFNKKKNIEALFTNIIYTSEPQPTPNFANTSKDKTVQGLVIMLNEADMSGHTKRLIDFARRDIESLDKAFALIQQEEDKIKDDVNLLGKTLNTLDSHIDEQRHEISQKIKKAETLSMARVDQHAKQIQSELAVEKAKLEQENMEKYRHELLTQRQRYLKELQEELEKKALEIQAEYVTQIQHQVENERGGRLSQIERVAERQSKLEKYVYTDAEILDDSRKAHRLIAAIDTLKHAALGFSCDPTSSASAFLAELETLKKLSSQKTPFAKVGERQSDELIQVITQSIEDQVAQHGITSLAALSERFETVAREVRRASLIPENEEHVSIMSHLVSIILSHFMFKKKGLVPGDDVESRLARAEYYLNTEKDLESAAREMNQLKGWPKRLSMDWLDAARRHLEIKQALDILKSQASLTSMLQSK